MAVRLITVLCLLGYAISDPLVVTDHNPVFLQGRPASLKCNFHGIPKLLYWYKGDIGEEPQALIAWRGGTIRSENDTGKFSIGKDFSLQFDADASDGGRYYCYLSYDGGMAVKGYTDVTVAVPPSVPFPWIEEFMIPSGNQLQPITCRADGASKGLVLLQWEHDGTPYPQTTTNKNNADAMTENVTATINASASEKPFYCVAILNASQQVTARATVFLAPYLETTRAQLSLTEAVSGQNSGPSLSEKTPRTTPSKPLDNNSSIAIAVTVTIFIGALIAAICVYYFVTKNNLYLRVQRFMP